MDKTLFPVRPCVLLAVALCFLVQPGPTLESPLSLAAWSSGRQLLGLYGQPVAPPPSPPQSPPPLYTSSGPPPIYMPTASPPPAPELPNPPPLATDTVIPPPPVYIPTASPPPAPAHMPEASPPSPNMPEGSPPPVNIPEASPPPANMPEGPPPPGPSPFPPAYPTYQPAPPPTAPPPMTSTAPSPPPAYSPEGPSPPASLPEGASPPVSLPGGSQPPASMPEASPPPASLPETSPPPASMSEGSPPPTSLPDNSPPPANILEASPPPASTPEGSPPPAGLPAGPPPPASMPEGSPPPAGTPAGSPPPAGLPEGSPPPAGLPEGSPPPDSTPAGSPPPAGLPEGSPPPASTPEGAPPPASMPEGSPPPVNMPMGSPPPRPSPSPLAYPPAAPPTASPPMASNAPSPPPILDAPPRPPPTPMVYPGQPLPPPPFYAGIPPVTPPSAPPPPTTPPTPPASPCDICQTCLDILRPLVELTSKPRLPGIGAEQPIAHEFLKLCEEQPFLSTADCVEVAFTILSGGSNIAARAGALCAATGACDLTLNCTFTATSFDTNGQLTGGLDLCTAEGVAGGRNTSLPSTTPWPGSCRSRAECDSGQVCFMGDDEDAAAAATPAQVCSCVDGQDECYDLGNCTSYCDLRSTTRSLRRLNAGADSCTPDENGGAGSGCGADQVCARVANCRSWACNSTSQVLAAASCSGKCRPLRLRAESAQITDSGDSILVQLNAFPEGLVDVPCDLVFDGATAELLGGALCSTDDDVLVVGLTPNSEIKPGQRLVFAAASALVSAVDNTALFAGNITVTGCGDTCVRPVASLTGPASINRPCEGDSADSLLQAAGALPPAFDASQSLDPSGRVIWADVQWSLDRSGPGSGSAATSAGWDTLQAVINRTNALPNPSDRLVLFLTAEEANSLPVGRAYGVSVRVVSWLGSTSNRTFYFDKRSTTDGPPSTGVVGPSVQTFRISTGLRASAVAGQVCAGRSLDWKWSAPGWMGLPAGSTAALQQQLFVPPPVLAVHGQDIRLSVTGTFNNMSGLSANSSVTAQAIGSMPVPKLRGPSGDVADDVALLVFNATGSLDPDTSRALQRLRYKWECRREDFPAPCFTSADQGDDASTPGVWLIPTQLLTRGKLHTIAVTVSKVVPAGASPLRATASLTFRPRAASEGFPRGNLSRQCSAAACDQPHRTDLPLTVMLSLDSAYRFSGVKWFSPEVNLSSLVAASRDTDSTIPRGTHLLTIPPASLPAALPSITVIAVMNVSSSSVNGSAFVTVPLNAPPACAANRTNPSACVKVTLVSDTFPTAVVSIRAQGFTDPNEFQLGYEFGVRKAPAGGDGGTVDMPQQLGVLSSATLVGLEEGEVTVYGCAIDSQGARTCGTAVVRVRNGSSTLNPSSLLSAINIVNLRAKNDVQGLFQAARQTFLVVRKISRGGGTSSNKESPSLSGSRRMMLQVPVFGLSGREPSAKVDAVVSSQTVALVYGIMNATNLADTQQVVIALTSIADAADSAAGVLSDEASNVILTALDTLSNALSGSSSGGTLTATSATQTCSILAASVPTRGDAAASLSWLRQVVSATGRLAEGLGRTATPGGATITAGSNGVFVAAGAVVVSGSGSTAAAAITIRSGQGAAGSTGSTTTAGRRRELVSGVAAGGDDAEADAEADEQEWQEQLDEFRRWRLEVMAAAGGALSRRSLQTDAAVTYAEAALVLAGDAAARAAGYSVGLSHVPLAATPLPAALGAALPSLVSLRGGLTTVSWSAVAADAAAQPPLLDGAFSYITLRLPAPGYIAGRIGNCVLYNATANTLKGDLDGMLQSAGASTATFVSYNSTSGIVTCRAAAVGSYVVAQSPNPLPLPPSPPGPPRPPPAVQQAAPAPEPAPTPSPGGGGGDDDENDLNVGAIIGGVIGGVAFIILVVLLVLFVRRRRRQQAVSSSSSPPAAASGPDAVRAADVPEEPAAEAEPVAATATSRFQEPTSASLAPRKEADPPERPSFDIPPSPQEGHLGLAQPGALPSREPSQSAASRAAAEPPLQPQPPGAVPPMAESGTAPPVPERAASHYGAAAAGGVAATQEPLVVSPAGPGPMQELQAPQEQQAPQQPQAPQEQQAPQQPQAPQEQQAPQQPQAPSAAPAAVGDPDAGTSRAPDGIKAAGAVAEQVEFNLPNTPGDAPLPLSP